MPEPKHAQRLPPVLQPTEEDIQLMLSAQCHIGTKNYDKQMSQYIYKRRPDGINLINLGKTWEKLVLAARVIVTIDNPSDVCVISARPYGHRAVLKYASHTGAQPIAGRFTPGSFTNYITRSFKEPRLIVVTDPRQDHQAIREASYTNIPVIAFCDTDAPMKFVDIAIPTSNKSKPAIGLMWWLLCREVLRLRGTVTRQGEGAFNKMPDTFFYRDPEEVEEQQQQQAAEAEANAAAAANPDAADPYTDTAVAGDEKATTDWASEAPVGDWGATEQTTTQW